MTNESRRGNRANNQQQTEFNEKTLLSSNTEFIQEIKGNWDLKEKLENINEFEEIETKTISQDHDKSTFQFDHEIPHHVLSKAPENNEILDGPLNRYSAFYKLDFINKILESLPNYVMDEGSDTIIGDKKEEKNEDFFNPDGVSILRPKPFSTMRRPEKES